MTTGGVVMSTRERVLAEIDAIGSRWDMRTVYGPTALSRALRTIIDTHECPMIAAGIGTLGRVPGEHVCPVVIAARALGIEED